MSQYLHLIRKSRALLYFIPVTWNTCIYSPKRFFYSGSVVNLTLIFCAFIMLNHSAVSLFSKSSQLSVRHMEQSTYKTGCMWFEDEYRHECPREGLLERGQICGGEGILSQEREEYKIPCVRWVKERNHRGSFTGYSRLTEWEKTGRVTRGK